MALLKVNHLTGLGPAANSKVDGWAPGDSNPEPAD